MCLPRNHDAPADEKKPPTGSNRKGAVLVTSGHKLVVTRSELVTKGGHEGQASGVNHQKNQENMVFFARSNLHTPHIYSLVGWLLVTFVSSGARFAATRRGALLRVAGAQKRSSSSRGETVHGPFGTSHPRQHRPARAAKWERAASRRGPRM